jgi:hypothetical protein
MTRNVLSIGSGSRSLGSGSTSSLARQQGAAQRPAPSDRLSARRGIELGRGAISYLPAVPQVGSLRAVLTHRRGARATADRVYPLEVRVVLEGYFERGTRELVLDRSALTDGQARLDTARTESVSYLREPFPQTHTPLGGISAPSRPSVVQSRAITK